jgi:predicted anti-sigma-YlaC factor YlaD
MSECKRISGLFCELHEEHVDGETETVVWKHLGSCPGCREDFKWYGITVRALTNLERVTPPRDFVAQLNARLHDTRSHSFVEFFRNIFSAAPYVPLPVGVSALALVVVTGFVFYNYPTTEMIPSTASSQSFYVPGTRPGSDPRIAAKGVGPVQPQQMQVSTLMPASETTSSSPAGHLPLLSKSTPDSLGNNIETVSRNFPTIADRIGADNLTVESPSIDKAIESLKRILPNIQGRLVDEKNPGQVGEVVVGVMIPSDAYGNLTTELINHGAVAAGMNESEAKALSPAKKDGNNVLLYIRFVRTR